MKIFRSALCLNITLCTAAGLMTACSGGGSSGSASGTFSLAVTDAPVDSAVAVVVEFTGVSIKPADGEVIEFNFTEPRQIDLLQLQGSLSDGLVSDQEVPAGNYEWVRLHVNAENDGVLDSYIERDDGTQQELRIPSGSQSGLKLVRGFTIAAGGAADFTVDFDLRKSITDPGGMPSAILKPALRLVDNLTVGSIEGSVSFDLINAQCADPINDDGSVYVFTGADLTPMDVQGSATDPIASALVNLVDESYIYEVGFLPEGSYTVAYTCDAGTDDPEAADTLNFIGAKTVVVVADMPSSADFDLESEDTADTSSESESSSEGSSSSDAQTES